MSHYETINDILVNLFHKVWDMEEKALIIEPFRDISVNDMHIIEAIGMEKPQNMSSVARLINVTVGTLTISMNNLVKKGYVMRVRSEEDRRVVLISLSEKGKQAYEHHRQFHQKMVKAVLEELNPQETEIFVHALNKLSNFFRQYEHD